MNPSDQVSLGDGASSELESLRRLVAAMRPCEEGKDLEPLRASPGKVIVYDPRGLERFGVIPGRDRSSEGDRRKALIERMTERGGERSLGAWPGEGMLRALDALKISHPNFTEVTDYVIGEAVFGMEQGRAICGLRLLIDGPPGVGKTDYASALTRALELPLRISCVSAASSGFEIAGLDEGYSGSRPGMVFEEVTEGLFANPAFLLDEIDKAPESRREAIGALYQLLETHTARAFRDRAVPFLALDASYVNWMATANEVDAIEPALLSRFQRFVIQPPTPAQHRGLVQRLYQQMAQDLGLADRYPAELPPGSVECFVRSSAREIKRALRMAFMLALRTKADKLVFDKPMLERALAAHVGGDGGSASTSGQKRRSIGFIWPAQDTEVTS